jgi:CarS bacterial SH3 domain
MGDLTEAKCIFANVVGAPIKIGARVKVVKLTDETANRSWLGRTGVVKFFSYDCGCGQSFPDDPMIGVESPRGKVEEFWKEELRHVSRCRTKRRV